MNFQDYGQIPANPLVSVIIPCYKQAHFLPDAVQSVVDQTYTNWECIIVNDGSPDDTNRVADKLIKKYPKKAIRLIEKDNGGLPDARNQGIRASKGIYWLPLDADDMILPAFLEKAVKVLQKHPEVGFVYSHIQHFGIKREIYYLPEFDPDTIVHADNTACVCSLVRRCVWDKIGGYNTMMKEGYEDWDFWVGCIEHGWKGYRIPEPLFKYCLKRHSMLTDATQKREQLIARIVMNHPALYHKRRLTQAEEIQKGKEPGKVLSRILIASSRFWPFQDEIALCAENLGNQLVKRGFRVDVATSFHQGRYSPSHHRGMNIIPLDTAKQINGIPSWFMDIAELISSKEYQTCILLSDFIDPIQLTLQYKNRFKDVLFFVQLFFDQESYQVVENNRHFKESFVELLKRSSSVILSSQSGLAADFMQKEGIEFEYIPQACEESPQSTDFRTEHIIPKECFVILIILDQWAKEDNLNFIPKFSNIPINWRIVIIIQSSESNNCCSLDIIKGAKNISQFICLNNLTESEIHDSIRASDIVLVYPTGRTGSMAILKAMSHKKPWISLTDCDAINEYNGGVIVESENLTNIIYILHDNPDIRCELGETGYYQWKSCHTWECTMESWESMIESGRCLHTYELSPDLKEKQKRINNKINFCLSSFKVKNQIMQKPNRA